MPSFSPAGKQAPLMAREKALAILGEEEFIRRQEAVQSEMRTDRFEQRSLWMILPSAGWRGPPNTDSSSSRSGARLNRMTGILRAHAEARAFPRVVMVVSSSQGTYWPILHRSASGRTVHDETGIKNANRKEKTQGPLPQSSEKRCGVGAGHTGE